MKNRNIVKQDFKLVNAKYKLDTFEIKFILTALAQIDADDVEFKEYEIKVSELESKLQAELNETRLKQFAKRLMSKPLEVPTDSGWIVFNWFSKIQYFSKDSKFVVKIDDDLKPYLIELKERFIKYNLSYILPLSSNYSIRIYQLLKEYEKLKIRTFSLTELQDLLQVPPSLKIYNRFKEKVLLVAQKELFENCDIFFDYEEKKERKKVTDIIFRINANVKKKVDKNPALFECETSKYAQYIGCLVDTVDGHKTIALVTPYDKFLKIDFTDGTSKNVEYLKFVQAFALGGV